MKSLKVINVTCERRLLVSTGIYRLAFMQEPNPVNSILELLSRLKNPRSLMDGVEVNIRTPEYLRNLFLSSKAKDFIREFDHHTLHFFYTESLFCDGNQDFIGKLMELNGIFQFRNVVVHPIPKAKSEFPEFARIFREDIGIPRVSVENMLNEHEVDTTTFEEYLKDPSIDMIYDIAHAQVCSLSQYPDLVYHDRYLARFIDRVRYIHLSSVRSDIPRMDGGRFCPHAGHGLFHQTLKSDNIDMMRRFSPNFKGKPFLGIILETGIRERKLSILEEEIAFVRANILPEFNALAKR